MGVGPLQLKSTYSTKKSIYIRKKLDSTGPLQLICTYVIKKIFKLKIYILVFIGQGCNFCKPTNCYCFFGKLSEFPQTLGGGQLLTSPSSCHTHKPYTTYPWLQLEYFCLNQFFIRCLLKISQLTLSKNDHLLFEFQDFFFQKNV